MPIAKRIFVGRKIELEQFKQALGRPGFIDRVVLGNPGRSVKSRVFLPHGIGGIGKSELTRQCLELAKQAGWRTLFLDWNHVGYSKTALAVLGAGSSKRGGNYAYFRV